MVGGLGAGDEEGSGGDAEVFVRVVGPGGDGGVVAEWEAGEAWVGEGVGDEFEDGFVLGGAVGDEGGEAFAGLEGDEVEAVGFEEVEGWEVGAFEERVECVEVGDGVG